MVSSFLRSALAVLAGVLIAAGCSDSKPTSPSDADLPLELIRRQPAANFSRAGSETAPASGWIGPEGGSIRTASGNQLKFPAGAVAEPTLITMQDDPVLAGVHLQPHGLRFPQEARPTLTLRYSATTAANYRAVSIVRVEGGQIVERLPTSVDKEREHTSALIHHLSGYIQAGG